jgi:hypothetical protein
VNIVACLVVHPQHVLVATAHMKEYLFLGLIVIAQLDFLTILFHKCAILAITHVKAAKQSQQSA